MFEILPESDGGDVAIKASGKLTHEAYAALTPELEQRIKGHGKLNILLDITAFDGWDLHGAWDDFMLGIKHMGDFDRIAVVGDAKWEEVAIKIAGVMMSADVRFFPAAERKAAWSWTRGALAA